MVRDLPEGSYQQGRTETITPSGLIVSRGRRCEQYGQILTADEESDSRASGQAQRRGAGENCGGDDTKAASYRGHGVGSNSEENRRKKNCEKRDCQENFHKDLLHHASGHSGKCKRQSKGLFIWFLYLRCTCPLGHRNFGRKKVNLARSSP